MAAAAAEALALAEVEHPNIVRIYNVVEHADPDVIPVADSLAEAEGLEHLHRRRVDDGQLGHGSGEGRELVGYLFNRDANAAVPFVQMFERAGGDFDGRIALRFRRRNAPLFDENAR